MKFLKWLKNRLKKSIEIINKDIAYNILSDKSFSDDEIKIYISDSFPHSTGWGVSKIVEHETHVKYTVRFFF